MTSRRIGLGIAGIVLLVLGRWLTIGEYLSVEPLVDALGNDLYVVGIVSIVGLVTIAAILVRWRSTHVDETEMPDVEGRVSVPAPGAPFDDELSDPITLLPIVGTRRRERIHDRLRTAAVRSIQSANGCDEETARDRLESGNWTENERARRFLRSSPEYEVVDRLRLNLRGRSWFRRAVHDSVRTLVENRREQFGRDIDPEQVDDGTDRARSSGATDREQFDGDIDAT